VLHYHSTSDTERSRWPRRLKAWVCCRPLIGIAGGMDVCTLGMLCDVRYRSLRRVLRSSKGDLLSVACPMSPVREGHDTASDRNVTCKKFNVPRVDGVSSYSWYVFHNYKIRAHLFYPLCALRIHNRALKSTYLPRYFDPFISAYVLRTKRRRIYVAWYSWIRASQYDSVEIPTRCNFVIEFIIPKFTEGSTCFERHTSHHQELYTV
jgi:hypothetical protein